jgi:hypothetical protein
MASSTCGTSPRLDDRRASGRHGPRFDGVCVGALLVEFDANSSDLFSRYFGLKESLEALYGRDVDLVTVGALRNPFFIESVNKTRQLVYAAENAEAA